MSPRRDAIDRDFAQFCRNGDAEALGRVFDEVAGQLFRVALWLCGNRTDAEDALQRTFLQAIEVRHQFAQGRSAVAWLLGLLGNQVHKQRRDRSRPAPTPAARAAQDPTVEAAKAELEAAVETVRLQLGDTYREVLRLHLQEGLNAREIATALRRPAGTVRTQLMRALQALRARLPSGFLAGIGPGWLPSASAAPSAVVRVFVLQSARAKAGRGLAQGAPDAWRWLVPANPHRKVLVALAAIGLTLGLGLPLLLGDIVGDTAPAEYLSIDANGVLVRAPATLVATNRTEPADAGTRREPAVNAPTFAQVAVRLAWADSGEPAEGQIVACGTGSHPLLGDSCTTDAMGRCEFAHVVPGRVQVSVLGAAAQYFVLTAGERHECVLDVTHGLRLVGCVVDEQDRPVADALVIASNPGMSQPTRPVARSDAIGRFAVDVPNGNGCFAIKTGHGPSLLWRASGPFGETVERTLQLRGSGGRLEGTVRDRLGAAIPFAQVFAGPRNESTPHGQRDTTAMEPPAVPSSADAEGHFVIDGLPAGSLPVQAWARGCAPWLGSATLTPGATTALAIVLDPGAAVTGTVRDAHGQPVADATVNLRGPDGEFGSVSISTDDMGHYAADSLRPGTLDAKAGRYPLGRSQRELQLSAGRITNWDAVLDAGRCVRGRVLDDAGHAVAKATVGWHRQGQREDFRQTDERGGFLLTNLPDEPVHVAVYGARWVPLFVEHDVLAPRDDLLLVITHEREATASVHGRIVDAEGRAVHCQLLLAGEFSANGNDGSFHLQALSPDRYELSLRIEDIGMLPWRAFTLHADECLDLGDFVVAPTCQLRVNVRNTDGTATTIGAVSLSTHDGLAVYRRSVVRDGSAVIEALQPGRYVVYGTSVQQQGIAEVEVLAQHSNEVTVQLGPVVLCKVRCTAPYPLPDGAKAEVVVDCHDGQPPRRCLAPITDDGYAGENLVLPPGRHVFTAHCGATTGEIELLVSNTVGPESACRVNIPLLVTTGR